MPRPEHLRRPRSKVIATRVPTALHERLKREAELTGQPMSDLISGLLERAMEEQEIRVLRRENQRLREQLLTYLNIALSHTRASPPVSSLMSEPA
jgi:predicted DNA-binding protein